MSTKKKLQNNSLLKSKTEQVINLYNYGEYKEAKIKAYKLHKKYPKIIILNNILGLILTNEKNFNEAIKYFQRAIKLKPDLAVTYNNLANVYKAQGNLIKAKKYYKKALTLDPNSALTYNNLGVLYDDLDEFDNSVFNFKKSIEINPRFYVAYNNLGILYKQTGSFNEAKNYFDKSIKINPNFFAAHRNLGQLVKYKTGDNHLIQLEKFYDNPNILPLQRRELAFALGKAYDDLEDFDKAYKYFYEGNLITKQNLNFSINEEKKIFENIKKTFTKDIYKKNKNIKRNSVTPIFILGMPRSGTSLIEQILSSHPSVYGCGELYYLTSIVKSQFLKKNIFSFKNLINKKENILKDIGDEYINMIKKISNSNYITDKFPLNFKWIGLIKLILPNAKIIHCVRDARATCFSIFKNLFPHEDMNFCYDLNDLKSYHNIYINLIKHWHNVLPNFIYDIKYENVINNSRYEIKNLLSFCNLPWNEKCFKFHENKRTVKTASDTQVRKPIYKGSLVSWKDYEKSMNSFFKNLKN